MTIQRTCPRQCPPSRQFDWQSTILSELRLPWHPWAEVGTQPKRCKIAKLMTSTAYRKCPASLAGCVVLILLAFWPKQLVEDFRRVVLGCPMAVKVSPACPAVVVRRRYL